MKNLPIGQNDLRILMDYTTKDGDPYIRFMITKRDRKYKGAWELKELVEDEADESGGASVHVTERSDTHRISFDTSDSSPLHLLIALAMLSGIFSALCFKVLRRNRILEKTQ